MESPFVKFISNSNRSYQLLIHTMFIQGTALKSFNHGIYIRVSNLSDNIQVIICFQRAVFLVKTQSLL